MTPETLLESLRAYAEECFVKQTPVRVKELASILGLSRQYISKKFMRLVGASPSELLVAIQIAEAKRLLETTSKSTEEVAWAAGFGTQRTLYRIFVQKVGIPPEEFRKQATKCQ